ncbi:MAG: Uma2 family endonuclease, partial [Chloroflexota bacterium]
MSIRDLNRLDTLPEEEEEDYYYDMHPTKEDLMGESVAQQDLMSHLISLLKELYHIEGWFVSGNLNIYRTADKKEYPLAPDVALFKGVVLSRATRVPLRSWKMVLPERPAPTVVFEICSKETWKDDLKKKPEKYRQMGVKEYYAYDPNMPQYWSDRPNRLRGWHYQAGELIELKLDERGWLWSNELDSWLVPDGE